MTIRRSSTARAQNESCDISKTNALKLPDSCLGQISLGQGQSILLSVNDFKGKQYVDIRVWTWINGKPNPTTKGVCLPADSIEEIEKYLTRAKQIRDA